jgi:hypothetical protein
MLPFQINMYHSGNVVPNKRRLSRSDLNVNLKILDVLLDSSAKFGTIAPMQLYALLRDFFWDGHPLLVCLPAQLVYTYLSGHIPYTILNTALVPVIFLILSQQTWYLLESTYFKLVAAPWSLYIILQIRAACRLACAHWVVSSPRDFEAFFYVLPYQLSSLQTSTKCICILEYYSSLF